MTCFLLEQNIFRSQDPFTIIPHSSSDLGMGCSVLNTLSADLQTQPSPFPRDSRSIQSLSFAVHDLACSSSLF